jgi:hypothetical protein
VPALEGLTDLALEGLIGPALEVVRLLEETKHV